MKFTTFLLFILLSSINLMSQESAETGKKDEVVKYDVSFDLDQLVYHRYRVTEYTKVKRVFEDSTSNEFEKSVTHWFTVFVPGAKDKNGFLKVEIRTDSLDYKFDSNPKKVAYATRDVDEMMPINFMDFFQSFAADNRAFNFTYSPYGDIALVEGKEIEEERKNYTKTTNPIKREQILNAISDNKLKFLFDVPKGVFPPFEATLDTSWKSEIRYYITNVPFTGEITNSFKGYSNKEYHITSNIDSLKLEDSIENNYFPDLDKYGSVTKAIATGTINTDMHTGGTVKYVKANLKAILAGKISNIKYNQIIETTYTWDLLGKFSY